MALPSYGTISITDIAAYLGISANGRNLNDSRVRNLTSRPSGIISLNDCRYQPISVNWNGAFEDNHRSSQRTFNISFQCSTSGGRIPLTYSWTWQSNPSGFLFTDREFGNGSIVYTFPGPELPSTEHAYATLRCTASDGMTSGYTEWYFHLYIYP
jgi:hypothetical protein